MVGENLQVISTRSFPANLVYPIMYLIACIGICRFSQSDKGIYWKVRYARTSKDMDGTLQLIMNFMKCPNRADQMCVFEVDGVVNLVVSSKTLDQNLSTEGSKVFFFEFNGLFCCSNKEGFFLTNFRLFWGLSQEVKI